MFHQRNALSTEANALDPVDRQRTIATDSKLKTRSFTQGFTMLELIVTVLIISILFAMMAPGWAVLMNTQRLNAGQERVLQAMRDAQSHAKHNQIVWQASFQERNGVVQWAVHAVNATPIASAWSSLDSAIQLDAETTLQQSGGVRRVQFDHEGHVNGQLGRLTLSNKNGGKAKRCVVVSTLLGAIRTGSEHSTMQDGKYCY
jgi:prepilin-type N-terminal cleavage/methylation domain-containing protein